MSTTEPPMIEEEAIPPVEELAELLAQQKYYTAVRNRIRFLVNDPELVEDLTQNAYVKILQSLGTINSMHNLSAWLYQVATTTVYDYHRIKRNQWNDACVKMSAIPLEYAGGHDPTAAYDKREDVVRNWPLLTKRQEAVLSMLAQGFSMPEIEEKLGKKESVIYEARRIGRKTLLTGTVATRKTRVYGKAS